MNINEGASHSNLTDLFATEGTRSLQYINFHSNHSEGPPIDISFHPLNTGIFTSNNTFVDESINLDDRLNLLGINITAECWKDGYDLNRTCYDPESSAINDTTDQEPDFFGLYSDERNWPFLLLILLIVGGGLGNILVCLAVRFEKRLQNTTNYFLVSLALADLLVCFTVVPLCLLDGYMGGWPFDWRICSIWVTCDVLTCTASIMHLSFISLDRYLGIRNPLQTRSKSKKVVMMKIIFVWVVSLAVTAPIVILAYIEPRNILAMPGLCAIDNAFYFAFSSIVAFYVPMFVIVVTYILTVRLLQKKAAFLAEEISKSVFFVERDRKLSPASLSDFTENDFMSNSVSNCPHCGRCPGDDAVCRDSKVHESRPASAQDFIAFQEGKKTNGHILAKSEPQFVPGLVKHMGSKKVANEQKATKVLGIVFFVFFVAWAPFFTLMSLIAITGEEEDIVIQLGTIFQWLGYFSSTLNPIIYTIFNRKFRRAFYKLLTGKSPVFKPTALH